MSATSAEIRPFKVKIPEAELTELRARIVSARLPGKETVPDLSQGTKLETVKQIAGYWASGYDWRKVEARLNSYPQFITEIDGLDIHFIHVRSKHRDALPLIVTHGWPGSVIEQVKIIDPLVNPTAHGGKASDAFHVVIPSMPGYGFSGKPTTTGWGPDRIARAWAVLMKRLGYTKYAAQGGDWGAVIVDLMALQKPQGLVGIHTNMAGVVPAALDAALFAGNPVDTTGFSAEEKRTVAQLDFFYKRVGYANQMGRRPQSLVGLTDSPLGLASYLLDHDHASQELISQAFAGNPGGLSRDDFLDNVTLYWLTDTAVSAARLYWENKFQFFSSKGVTLPVAVSVFPHEIYEAPKSWTEKAYPNLIHYNTLPTGGHFAAWEQPTLFVHELRKGLRPLR
ncbi:epoxide hydrolase family protein [Streptomyces sp. NPDC058964]|uniref:epoxide hydrolase family protein n=1 Tax=Streptomyces sp. NPDC058964 TaxID=3346681 RepID=UPI00368B0A44